MIRSKPKPELIEHADGRIELRGRLYTKMRQKLCQLADERCEMTVNIFGELSVCGRYTPINEGEAHHVYGRGGGKRDDRIFVCDTKGEFLRNLLWACPACHDRKHRPAKVVPAKMSDQEFKQMLGLSEQEG